MATVDFWGPYYFTQTGNLPAGSSMRVGWLLGGDIWASTFLVTGTPLPGGVDSEDVLSVSDVGIGTAQHSTPTSESLALRLLATFNNEGPWAVDVVVAYLSRVGA